VFDVWPGYDVNSSNNESKDTKAKKAAVKKTPAEPVKKDGTPDKRYKANKKAPVGPVKKDGTPDKRYKANKTP
jgi:hypothetical protein